MSIETTFATIPFEMWSKSLLFLTLAAAVLGEEIKRAVPQTIQLTSRMAPKRRSLKSRQLAPTTIPLADFFLGTDLQWVTPTFEGIFANKYNTDGLATSLVCSSEKPLIMQLTRTVVGTPPQPVSVVFDTGSVTLEFTSTLCGTACSNQIKFDPTKSRTFVDGGRTSSITFSTGVGVDPVVGANYRLTLRSGRDVVSVGGLSAGTVDLSLVTDQTPKFAIDPFSGILGMGATAVNVFGGLVNQGLPSLFSMFLTPNAVGEAELTFGGIDNTKFQGPLTFASLPSTSGRLWELPSPQISINGRTTTTLRQRRTVIFDSGTSNILFSTATTEAIYALISPDIKPNPAEPGAYGIACNRINTLPAVIDIGFTAQNGQPFNLTIPSTELNVGPFANDPTLCQTLINAFDGLDLVGGSVLKHYYSVWDIGNRRMGFAPNGL
ncbi:hypothetical protein EYR36_006763 [Pleurotus pulmonarius]|nr:hypothetical protein EYR36_006763 [Pleurotus pulmonarius]